MSISGGHWWTFVMGESTSARRSGTFSRMEGNLFGNTELCFGHYGVICNREKWSVRKFKIFMINYSCFSRKYFKIILRKCLNQCLAYIKFFITVYGEKIKLVLRFFVENCSYLEAKHKRCEMSFIFICYRFCFEIFKKYSQFSDLEEEFGLMSFR